MYYYSKKGFHITCIIVLLAVLILSQITESRLATGGSAAELSPDPPRIALTFDDGPHSVHTEALLDGLKERGVTATFFLIGCNIEGNEALVKRMNDEGHLIGNHTYTHIQLTLLSDDRACEEIWKTNMKIFDITGHIPEYIRPPFGSFSEELECAIDMDAVLWDIDTLDWKCKDSKHIVEYVCKNAKDGDIILLHDIYKSSVEAALEIIDYFTAEGYEFLTVDELILE
ncbi:MAG: polysaccharide deacetylase family protein [Lachnospiraceae bacterium]|nr:polysaccharide deacetylase family protein [Lachnospiraceae bacterium]